MRTVRMPIKQFSVEHSYVVEKDSEYLVLASHSHYFSDKSATIFESTQGELAIGYAKEHNARVLVFQQHIETRGLMEVLDVTADDSIYLEEGNVKELIPDTPINIHDVDSIIAKINEEFKTLPNKDDDK